MKSWLRFAFMAVAFGLFVGAFSVTEVSAQNKIREITKRMDAYNKSLTTLRTRVTMVKTSAQLGESDTTVGTAIYAKRPGKDALVRIDWEKPAESLAVKDGKYVMFRPRLGVAYEGSVKDASKGKPDSPGQTNSALAFMNMSKAQLEANYDVVLLAEHATLSSGHSTWHLKLTPKVRTSYKEAELWVDPDGMPRQTKITEHNNDTTTVLLTNPEPNVSLKASDFQISYPKGTKIQKS